MRQWLSGKTEQERRLFVNSLFRLFEATGKETFADILQEKGKSLAIMGKTLETMPRDQRAAVWGMLSGLVFTGSETLYQNARRGVRQLLDGLTARDKGDNPESTT